MDGFLLAIRVPVVFARKHAGFQPGCRIGRALPGGGKTHPGGKRRILDSNKLPLERQDFSDFWRMDLIEVNNLLNYFKRQLPALAKALKLANIS